jgi:L-fuconolactonase
MAVDKETWLKLTREDVIEPELPICDAHHHLWDHSGEIYLIDKFSEDISSGHKILKTVYVECYMRYRKDGPEALRPVGETEYVKDVAEKYALKHSPTKVAAGMVAFADLMLGDAVKPVLEEHLKVGGEMVRSIRCSTIWDADPMIRTTSPPGTMLDRKFRAGFACLNEYGLTFDTWLYFTQLPDLIGLVKEFSDTTVILNHMSGLIGIGAYAGRCMEIFTHWKGSISELAKYPNVYVKLGGLGTIRNGFGYHEREVPPGSDELAAAWTPYFNWCIELVGRNWTVT